MRHAFFTSPRPLVFAHRGGAALAPENTMAAFDNAAALGVDGLELDVRVSRDGVVVVHHDHLLERTTTLQGPVEARTADELARASVPALADVLARYRDARVIVEIKVDSADAARATVDVVRRADAVDRVCLGAFGRRVLREARAIEPAIATSAAREEVRWALYRSWVRWPAPRVGYSGFQVPERAGRTRVVSPRFIDAAHRAGLGVQVWTVDREDDARRLLDWGVDALITDRPDVILPLARALARAFDYQPVLQGALVALRPLRAEDYAALYAVAADPLIWEQHPARNRHEEAIFQVFFREALASGGALVVVDAKTQRVIGSSRFHGSDTGRSEVEIGWTFLARSHWGGRYNGEVKQLMLRHAFRFVRVVVFLVGPQNLRSQRAVEKIGGVRAGSRRDAAGQESYVYEISASTFRTLNAAP